MMPVLNIAWKALLFTFLFVLAIFANSLINSLVSSRFLYAILFPAIYTSFIAGSFYTLRKLNKDMFYPGLSVRMIPVFLRKIVLWFIVSMLFIGIIMVTTGEDLWAHPIYEQGLSFIGSASFASMIMVATLEEFTFRYCILGSSMQNEWAMYSGLLLSTLLFAFIHVLGNHSLMDLWFLLPGGLVLGMLYIMTRTIAAPIAFHLANNLCAFPGTVSPDTASVLDIIRACTHVYVALFVLTALWAKYRPDFRELKLSLSEV